jgi:iron-sulfur cluster repair protein YtfE (RIC family)
MCITINKYQNSINRLQQDIYPSLQQSLNTLSAENESSLADLSYTFSLVQKEFQSLQIFEEQIVFPTMLSLFDESGNENDVSPNVPEIIRLTSIKEEILTEIMDQIAAVVQHSEILTLVKNKDKTIVDHLQELINIFYDRFLPAKQSWKHLLISLQNGAAKCNNRHAGKCKCNQDNIHKTRIA